MSAVNDIQHLRALCDVVPEFTDTVDRMCDEEFFGDWVRVYADNDRAGDVLVRADADDEENKAEETAEFLRYARRLVPRLIDDRDAERKAWVRLVRSEAACACPGEGAPSDALLAEHEAAKQALRDLGVDIDALLGEP